MAAAAAHAQPLQAPLRPSSCCTSLPLAHGWLWAGRLSVRNVLGSFCSCFHACGHLLHPVCIIPPECAQASVSKLRANPPCVPTFSVLPLAPAQAWEARTTLHPPPTSNLPLIPLSRASVCCMAAWVNLPTPFVT